MTTEAKRQALYDFCNNHKHSEFRNLDFEICPFEDNPFCANHSIGSAPAEVIDQWYALFFNEPAPTIKDSGDRTQFPSGAVRDMHTGKGRMDLLPWRGIIEVAKHCEEGAIKYGEHNVDKGIPLHSLLDSGARHLAKYIAGEADEDHLRAACWNLLWALEQRSTHPELNDMPWSK